MLSLPLMLLLLMTYGMKDARLGYEIFEMGVSIERP